MKKRILPLTVLLLTLFRLGFAEGDGCLRFIEGFHAEKGKVTVYWEDEAQAGPYALAYQLADRTLDPQSEFIEEEIEGTAFTLRYLMPGGSYRLTVSDSLGHTAETRIDLPAPQPFADGRLTAERITMTALPCSRPAAARSGDAVRDNVRLNADDMAARMEDTRYGLRLSLRFPELAKDREYETMFVLRAPGGYTCVYSMDAVVYERHKTTYLSVYWPFVGEEFFLNLFEALGTFSPGRYTVTCYLDGMPAAETAFPVH